MSRRRDPVQIRAEHAAQKLFEKRVEELRLEIGLKSHRRILDSLVEALEFIVEHTGGSVLTDSYRADLAEVKRDIAAREHARRSELAQLFGKVVKGPWQSN